LDIDYETLPVHVFDLFPKQEIICILCYAWSLVLTPTSGALGSYGPNASWNKRKVQNEYNCLRNPSLNHRYKGIGGGYTFQKYSIKFVVKATSEKSFGSESQAFHPKSVLDSVKNSLDAFYRFSRPHTVIGTVSSSFWKIVLGNYFSNALKYNEFALLDNSNILKVLKWLTFYVWTGIKHYFCVSPCCSENIWHISIIFYWCVGGETPNMLFPFKQPIANLINTLWLLLYVSGCGCCLVYEYLYSWFESVIWRWNRQGMKLINRNKQLT